MLGILSNQIVPFKIADLVAAGVDDAIVEGAELDCNGFDRLMVIVKTGATATAAGLIKTYVENCAATGGTFEEDTTASVTHTMGAADTHKFFILDARLLKRYNKFV
jgi:hypothetical protein